MSQSTKSNAAYVIVSRSFYGSLVTHSVGSRRQSRRHTGHANGAFINQLNWGTFTRKEKTKSRSGLCKQGSTGLQQTKQGENSVDDAQNFCQQQRPCTYKVRVKRSQQSF
ncbi:hypothetical protein ACQKDD_14245 [Planococcus kocurii]|uniref:hypothetical protein n=1 Tax=Planococcus kocurii TaxID=1374 RepID=UPI003D060A89